MTGVSQRSSSSTIVRDRRRGRRRACAGRRGARRGSRRSSRATPYTVSSPAMRNRKQMSRMSSWVRRSPSTSACEEVAQQVVVAALARPLVEHLLEVRVDRVGGLPAGTPRSRGGRTSWPTTWSGRMTPSFIFRNRGSSSIGRPNSVRNTCDGNGVENCAEKSISSSSTNAVDEVVHQPGDRVLQRPHPLRREQGVEDLAVLPVVRRIDLERDQRALGLEVVRRRVRREESRGCGAPRRRPTGRSRSRRHRRVGTPACSSAASSRSAGGSSPPRGSSAGPTRRRSSRHARSTEDLPPER